MFDDDCEYEHPVRRFRPIDAVVALIALPRAIFGTIANWFEELLELVAAHANWQTVQEQTPVKVTR